MAHFHFFSPTPRFDPCQFNEFEIDALPYPQVGHFSFDLSDLIFSHTSWNELEFLEGNSWVFQKKDQPHFFFDLKSDRGYTWKIALSSNGSFIAHSDARSIIPIPLILRRHGSPCSSFVRTQEHDKSMAHALDRIADFFENKPLPVSARSALLDKLDPGAWVAWWQPTGYLKHDEGDSYLKENLFVCAVIAQAQTGLHVGDLKISLSGHPVDEKGRIRIPDITLDSSLIKDTSQYKKSFIDAMTRDLTLMRKTMSSAISSTTTPQKTYEPGIIQGPSKLFFYHDFGPFTQHQRMMILRTYQEKGPQDVLNVLEKEKLL